MNYIVGKVLLALSLLALMSCSNGDQVEQSKVSPLSFAQVVSGKLDAGQTTYRSVRVSSDGLMEVLSWSDEGEFYLKSEPIKGSVDLYKSFVKLVNHKNTHESLGRRVNTIDVALVGDSDVQFTSFDQFPEGLAQIFETAFESASASPPAVGRYILLAPYTDVGVVDIDLTNGTCQSTLACGVKNAIETGKTFFGATDDLEGFIQHGRKNRAQFGVLTKTGSYRFWIVSA